MAKGACRVARGTGPEFLRAATSIELANALRRMADLRRSSGEKDWVPDLRSCRQAKGTSCCGTNEDRDWYSCHPWDCASQPRARRLGFPHDLDLISTSWGVILTDPSPLNPPCASICPPRPNSIQFRVCACPSVRLLDKVVFVFIFWRMHSPQAVHQQHKSAPSINKSASNNPPAMTAHVVHSPASSRDRKSAKSGRHARPKLFRRGRALCLFEPGVVRGWDLETVAEHDGKERYVSVENAAEDVRQWPCGETLDWSGFRCTASGPNRMDSVWSFCKLCALGCGRDY